MTSVTFLGAPKENINNSNSNIKAVLAGGAIGLAMPAVLLADTMTTLSEE